MRRDGRSGWWLLAECRDLDSDLFYPIGNTGDAVTQVAFAKAVCESCQVRSQCLTHALTTREQHGIWGGLTEEERRSLARRQRRALSRSKPSCASLPGKFGGRG